jgi:hypothetical protein
MPPDVAALIRATARARVIPGWYDARVSCRPACRPVAGFALGSTRARHQMTTAKALGLHPTGVLVIVDEVMKKPFS